MLPLPLCVRGSLAVEKGFPGAPESFPAFYFTSAGYYLHEIFRKQLVSRNQLARPPLIHELKQFSI
jgi:hypothetical protein